MNCTFQGQITCIAYTHKKLYRFCCFVYRCLISCCSPSSQFVTNKNTIIIIHTVGDRICHELCTIRLPHFNSTIILATDTNNNKKTLCFHSHFKLKFMSRVHALYIYLRTHTQSVFVWCLNNQHTFSNDKNWFLITNNSIA